MSQDDLRRVLQHLHDELGRASDADAATRARLRALQDEVRSALDRSPGGTLRERLEDAIVEFEASHPEVARRLAAVIDTLGFYNL
ncbi:MAG TPA: DUF4404 family protein [Gemmatimonadales bacterium]|nr:DUF4404 family protein [Gemmatimonadales bacterium]